MSCRGGWCRSRGTVGERVRVEGLAAPMRLMNSSEVLESEEISRAEMRVPVVVGVKVTVMVQVAAGDEGGAVGGGGEVGVVWRASDVDGGGAGVGEATVWGAEMLPTGVVAKVREFCEAV